MLLVWHVLVRDRLVVGFTHSETSLFILIVLIRQRWTENILENALKIVLKKPIPVTYSFETIARSRQKNLITPASSRIIRGHSEIAQDSGKVHFIRAGGKTIDLYQYGLRDACLTWEFPVLRESHTLV